jgi:hypothetical protein
MNRELLYIGQGEDIDMDITVLKNDGVTPLDMSGAAKFYVYLHDGYKSRKARYKTGTLTDDWHEMDISDAANGILSLKVLSTITKTLTPGSHYYIEIRVRWNSGAHADDNYFDLVETNRYAFTILESLINQLTTLP